VSLRESRPPPSCCIPQRAHRHTDKHLKTTRQTGEARPTDGHYQHAKFRRNPIWNLWDIAQKVRNPVRIRIQDPDPAQKLISSSLAWIGPACKISAKSVQPFQSYAGHRQTDRQTDTQTDKSVENITSLAEVINNAHWVLSWPWPSNDLNIIIQAVQQIISNSCKCVFNKLCFSFFFYPAKCSQIW